MACPNIKTFGKIWKKYFIKEGNVSVRRNKGVRGGKCYHCERIKIIGSQAKTKEQKSMYRVSHYEAMVCSLIV